MGRGLTRRTKAVRRREEIRVLLLWPEWLFAQNSLETVKNVHLDKARAGLSQPELQMTPNLISEPSLFYVMMNSFRSLARRQKMSCNSSYKRRKTRRKRIITRNK